MFNQLSDQADSLEIADRVTTADNLNKKGKRSR